MSPSPSPSHLTHRSHLILTALVAGAGLSFEVLQAVGHYESRGLEVALLVLALAVSREILLSGLRALRNFQLSKISLLVTLAALGACVLGEYVEAAVVLSLFTLGEELEALGLESSKSALTSLVSRSPKQAELKGRGPVPIEEIRVGDILVLRTGQTLAADGVVTAGEGSLDESSLTGEVLPRTKLPRDGVLSASRLVSGYLEIRVTKTVKDSTLNQIIEMTFKARAEKAVFHQFIERFSKFYTPLAIFSSLLVFAVPVLFFGGAWQHWLEQGLTLLVVACPCALVISTPVAIYAALGNAASRGVMVKGGRYLEALAKVDVVAFDKTRTLTEGRPRVVDILSFGPKTEKEVLGCAAGLEQYSEHPLAAAIVAEAKKRLVDDHRSSAYQSVPGKGASAQCYVCQGKERFVGSKTFALERLALASEVAERVAHFESQGKTSVLLWNESEVEGLISLQDLPKPEALASLVELKNQGLQLQVLSGDTTEAVRGTTRQLPVAGVLGGLLPEDKAQAIQTFQRAGHHVAMVGDGVNDAPALAVSEVGIAMGAAGSDTAIEVANVAILNDRLDRLPYLIALARRTWRVIRFNTFFAVTVKVAVLALAALGLSSLPLAIIADVGVTAFVVSLSLWILSPRQASALPTA